MLCFFVTLPDSSDEKTMIAAAGEGAGGGGGWLTAQSVSVSGRPALVRHRRAF